MLGWQVPWAVLSFRKVMLEVTKAGLPWVRLDAGKPLRNLVQSARQAMLRAEPRQWAVDRGEGPGWRM